VLTETPRPTHSLTKCGLEVRPSLDWDIRIAMQSFRVILPASYIDRGQSLPDRLESTAQFGLRMSLLIFESGINIHHFHQTIPIQLRGIRSPFVLLPRLPRLPRYPILMTANKNHLEINAHSAHRQQQPDCSNKPLGAPHPNHNRNPQCSLARAAFMLEA